MEPMVPFKYGFFHDVPRMIVLKYKQHLIMLESYFDEDKDDYHDSYSIQLLPSALEDKISESWKILFTEVGAKVLGTVPVSSVIFGSTKRKTLNPEFLEKYLDKTETPGAKARINLRDWRHE